MIQVKVQLFARLRELCSGCSSVELSLPAGADAAACFTALCADHPALATQRQGLAVAVNEEYADWRTALSDGDTVVFIPPVSGG